MLFQQVWQHIYISPSSASKEMTIPVSAKAGQAKLNNLLSVTPRTIAYTAIQVGSYLIEC
jgi:hypothetical protein